MDIRGNAPEQPPLVVRPFAAKPVLLPTAGVAAVLLLLSARYGYGHGVANDEQHAVVLLCSVTTAPWSVLWPGLRHFY